MGPEALLGLLGVLTGSILSYWLQKAHQAVQDRRKLRGMGKQLLFEMLAHQQDLLNITRQYLNPARDRKDRHISLKPMPDHPESTAFNIMSYSDLWTICDPQVFNRIQFCWQKYKLSVTLINQRSVAHQAMQESTYGKETPDGYVQIPIGMDKMMSNMTDNLYDSTDLALKEYDEVLPMVQKELISVLGKEGALKFETIPDETDNPPNKTVE